MMGHLKALAVGALGAIIIIYLDRRMGFIPRPIMADRTAKGDLQPT